MLEIVKNSTLGTANWVWNLITFQVNWYENYFYGLIVISLIVWFLEMAFPWRKNQKIIRKDFWLDGLYMFFNFFIFSIAISGFYELFSQFFLYLGFKSNSFQLIDFKKLPHVITLIVFFILNDFVQWFTHVLLHRFNFFWNFHKVHHSVKEMGFAAHLRYHWMENIFYKPLKTIVVMFVGGFEPEQAYIIHFIAIFIGHLNHANVRITWGPLKFLINNSVMHLYHHAKFLPSHFKYGVNYGISLSLWDYLFKTNYIPQSNDGNIELGWQNDDNFPTTFWKQQLLKMKK